MQNSYEQEIQNRVIEELRTLPAFSFRKKTKETLNSLFARRVSKYIDSKNINDVETSDRISSDKKSLLILNQKFNRIPNWIERLKISYELLSFKEKSSGYFSLFLFAIALLLRLFNTSFKGWFGFIIVLFFCFHFFIFLTDLKNLIQILNLLSHRLGDF